MQRAAHRRPAGCIRTRAFSLFLTMLLTPKFPFYALPKISREFGFVTFGYLIFLFLLAETKKGARFLILFWFKILIYCTNI